MSGVDRTSSTQGSAGPVPGCPASNDFYQLAWSDTDSVTALECHDKPTSYRERVAQILRETELGLSGETGGDMSDLASASARGLHGSNWGDDDVIFERQSKRTSPGATNVLPDGGTSVRAGSGWTGGDTDGRDHDNVTRKSTARQQRHQRDDGRLTRDTPDYACAELLQNVPG